MKSDPIVDFLGVEQPNPDELVDGELRLVLKTFAPHSVHGVPTYHLLMVNAHNGGELGGINLRVSGTSHIERYAGHIGFSVHPEHRGYRYAARAVRLLIPFARRIGFGYLWITCDPDNWSSRRSLELAGAEFVEVVDVPKDCVIHQSGHPRKCRYLLKWETPAP